MRVTDRSSWMTLFQARRQGAVCMCGACAVLAPQGSTQHSVEWHAPAGATASQRFCISAALSMLDTTHDTHASADTGITGNPLVHGSTGSVLHRDPSSSRP